MTETWGTEEIEIRTEPGVQTHAGHCTGELIHISWSHYGELCD